MLSKSEFERNEDTDGNQMVSCFVLLPSLLENKFVHLKHIYPT